MMEMATIGISSCCYGLKYVTDQDKSDWEIPRHDIQYPVRFYGSVQTDPYGRKKWVDGKLVSV